MSEATYLSPTSNARIKDSRHPAPVTGTFRVILYFLLIGNALFALIQTVGMIFWEGYLSATHFIWFDSICTLLYFIDIYAVYLLFRSNSAGFKLLIATSTVYALAEISMGYMAISGLTKGTMYFVLLYTVTGVIIPYFDVLLVRIFSGNKLKP